MTQTTDALKCGHGNPLDPYREQLAPCCGAADLSKKMGGSTGVKPFRVHIGGRRYRRFATLAEASAFCNEVHRRTRIILSVEKVGA